MTSVWRYIVAALLLIGAWHFVSKRVPEYLVPTPTTTLATLIDERGEFAESAKVTMGNAFLGGLIGISAGFLIGAIIAYARPLRMVLEPCLIIFQSFPREALLPLIVVWVGFGHSSKVVSAGLLSFFPTAIITLTALSDVRSEYLELIRGWGASRAQEFVFCRLPTAVPTLVGMLKVSIPLALVGAVLGEFMGGNDGLGHIIISEGAMARVDRVFAAVMVLAIIGITLWAAIQLLERSAAVGRFTQEGR